MNPFSGGGDNGAAAARSREAYRENAVNDGINNINGVFSQFNEPFFASRRQAYLDYAKPQLEDQYADARKQLTFALDRSGTLDSTARTQKEAELAKLYGTNSRAVSDAAVGYETSARNNIADAQTNLVNTVAQSGNANAASQQAISRAASLSQPDAYSPLGQLFGGFTNALQTQAALEKAGVYMNSPTGSAGRYNTGLFGGDSIRVY
ncbi:hypothetical protein [Reyranella sp.]|uniref:hypothetical protein n=1 Tax=Reyranella sp. TaxID=1929291 RepID=UPI003D0C5ED7